MATRNSKNPMFNRKHSDISKNLISKALSKSVYMYKIIDNELELKEIFPSSVKLAKLLNLHKSTIGRYIKKGKIVKWKSDRYLLKRSPISIDL